MSRSDSVINCYIDSRSRRSTNKCEHLMLLISVDSIRCSTGFVFGPLLYVIFVVNVCELFVASLI